LFKSQKIADLTITIPAATQARIARLTIDLQPFATRVSGDVLGAKGDRYSFDLKGEDPQETVGQALERERRKRRRLAA